MNKQANYKCILSGRIELYLDWVFHTQELKDCDFLEAEDILKIDIKNGHYQLA